MDLLFHLDIVLSHKGEEGLHHVQFRGYHTEYHTEEEAGVVSCQLAENYLQTLVQLFTALVEHVVNTLT